MKHVPEIGYLRLWQILGCPKTGAPPLVPVSKSTWWDGVRSGRFPAPTRALGGRIAAWRAEDIRALLGATPGGGGGI